MPPSPDRARSNSSRPMPAATYGCRSPYSSQASSPCRLWRLHPYRSRRPLSINGTVSRKLRPPPVERHRHRPAGRRSTLRTGSPFISINPDRTFIGDNLPGQGGYRLSQAEIDRVNAILRVRGHVRPRRRADHVSIGDLAFDIRRPATKTSSNSGSSRTIATRRRRLGRHHPDRRRRELTSARTRRLFLVRYVRDRRRDRLRFRWSIPAATWPARSTSRRRNIFIASGTSSQARVRIPLSRPSARN